MAWLNFLFLTNIRLDTSNVEENDERWFEKGIILAKDFTDFSNLR